MNFMKWALAIVAAYPGNLEFESPIYCNPFCKCMASHSLIMHALYNTTNRKSAKGFSSKISIAFKSAHPNSSTNPTISMGIRLPFLALHGSKIFKSQQRLQSRNQSNVPKGHIAVYVGEVQKNRFVVPISYLNHPLFLGLLNRAEEEFGFNHPMGGLTIPCKEEAFINLTSKLRASAS